MQLSPKQKEFWSEPFHRWNIKHGGTRTGKTYLDYFIIPRRIRERIGKEGLVVLLGNTRGTLQRNIIEPMQNLYSVKNVSDIKSDNTARIFGEKVYCLGADSIRHVDRIRGSSIKYCYGDELTTWNEEVFEMLKSRLDKPYSCFDATCNPKSPNHWVKKFIDSDVDIFAQNYCLDDNPFIDETVRKEMLREHKGVFYERYILGRWVAAEGAIYEIFANNTQKYVIPQVNKNDINIISIGIDYGASRSKTVFKATGFSHGFKATYALAEKDIEGVKTPERLYTEFDSFYQRIINTYGKCQYIFADYGALGQVLTEGLNMYCRRNSIPIVINDCSKGTIFDRIQLTTQLMAQGRFFILSSCPNLIKAFEGALWDSKHDDERLDDGTSDIDSLDAFEYSIYPFKEYLIKRGGNQ